MRKIITLSLVLVFAISFAYFGTMLFQDNKLQQDNRQLTVSGSSQKYTEDQLVNISDKIIKAKVVRVKDKFTKVIDATNSDGKKIDVKVPYIIYELEVIEDLENVNRNEKMELVLLDGEQNEKFIRTGGVGIFFLQNSPRQDIFKGAYIPVSLEQGIYNIVDENGQISSKLTREHINYDDLIDKIKAKASSSK